MSKLAGLQARARTALRDAASRVVVTQPTAAEPTDDGGSTAPAPSTAELWLYGTVGGYWWGFNSDDVAEALRRIGDVDEITVRLHSFGGSAIDGIAIANLLANHPARVLVVIDGIAASAATQIALAGAELVMSPGSQFMVHDAWMCTCGNAAELRADADWIEKQSVNYAETYAHRAGGTAAEWRARMIGPEGEDGTWYTAAEAVAAGLADRVDNIASSTPPPPLPDPSDFDDDADLEAAAAYDFEVLLSPAARAAWSSWSATQRSRTPKPPTASADGSDTTEGKGSAVAFSDEQINTLRNRLGVAEDADEATILAALDEALDEQANDAGTTTTTAPAVPEGMTLVSTEVFDQLRTSAQAGAEARQQQLEERRDRALTNAVKEGRIAPSQREQFATLWDADAAGTEKLLATLAPGLVPVAELGHAGDAEQTTADDQLYAQLYGSEKKGA